MLPNCSSGRDGLGRAECVVSAELVGHFGEAKALSWHFIKCQYRVNVGEERPVVAEVPVREEVGVDRGRVHGVQSWDNQERFPSRGLPWIFFDALIALSFDDS
jgi:hypothetical protein